jgi:hypothetical protein
MTRKLESISALFALTFLVMVASSAVAQTDRVAQNVGGGMVQVATLGCCRCLGGTNTLDLSTIPSNNWTVNGSAVAFLGPINGLWNINPGPAKWVSTAPNGGTGAVATGTYDYKLNFVVPNCAIEQRVTLSGNYGGDDDVYVYVDNVLKASCIGGWCFNAQHRTLSTLTPAGVGPGPHTLMIRVKNSGPSPSGMFVNAQLSGACRN